ncbi:membrane integrity-associated transporter subunit PqiC [Peteryoungia desertarenae]|uniref:Membrane integrity-associated transporter subunit PqiC n=1 Tax=Peteryoungia desertarenae TaxID=1813451 RepID=A0ABX6QSE4_9HYPH|nr:ABC-type transport auxiliary lipoprotein family protein [Peteryoungia desertarenae]QLF71429.1 membrane integrity-associated transporter subunit PqiC [Peteryoungia desertarenae]
MSRGKRMLAFGVLPVLLVGLSSCGTSTPPDTFDLSAISTVETSASARNRQLLIANPTALKALDSDQVLVRVSPSEIQYLSNSQWSDRLTLMVQSKLVQAFEDTERLGGVGIPGQGLAIDYQLITDIRAFEILTVGGDQAVVEISVKLLNDRNGTVRAQRSFRATAPARGAANEAYIQAMDRAFGEVTRDIVSWALTIM